MAAGAAAHVGQRARVDRDGSFWNHQLDVGVDPANLQRAIGFFTLHGTVRTLENWKDVIHSAIKMVMLQKHQTPRNLALRYPEVDKLSRYVIALDIRTIRNPHPRRLAAHPGNDFIDGNGRQHNNARVFAKTWLLVPSMHLTDTSTGMVLRDNKRISQLL